MEEERQRKGRESDMYNAMTTNYMRDVILQKIKWSMCVCVEKDRANQIPLPSAKRDFKTNMVYSVQN